MFLYFITGVYYSTVFDLQPSVNSCPSPWIYDSVSSTCTAPFGPGCHTVSVLSSASFAYIRGSASAVQFGATCAFGPASRPSTIDGTSERAIVPLLYTILCYKIFDVLYTASVHHKIPLVSDSNGMYSNVFSAANLSFR